MVSTNCYATAGEGIESLLTFLKQMDDTTAVEQFFTDEVSVMVVRGCMTVGERECGVTLVEYTWDSTCTDNMRPKILRLSADKDSETGRFWKYASNTTGLVFAMRESGKYVAVSPMAMKALCEKLHVCTMRFYQKGPDRHRNAMIIKGLYKDEGGAPWMEELGFVTRFLSEDEVNGTRYSVIDGVVSGTYSRRPYMDFDGFFKGMVKTYPEAGLEIGSWRVAEGKVMASIRMEGLRQRYVLGGSTVQVCPAINITNSDCGKSSLRLQAVITNGCVTKILKTRDVSHNGKQDPFKVAKEYELECISSIYDYLARLRNGDEVLWDGKGAYPAEKISMEIGKRACETEKKAGKRKLKSYMDKIHGYVQQDGGKLTGRKLELYMLEAAKLLQVS